MKQLIITLIILATAMVGCKKSDDNKQKCYWDAKVNSTYLYWFEKPSSDRIKRIQDSCACSVTVNETCVSCDIMITTPGGIDVPCR